MTLHHSLALEMAVFFAWNPIPATPEVLGLVAGSDRAHLGRAAVSEGATA
jgi:hypothetical protein